MNRYEEERLKLPRQLRRSIQSAFLSVWQSRFRDGSAFAGSGVIMVPTSGPPIRCVASLDRIGGVVEEHVSVSRGDGAPPPSWDDLVLIRSLAWSDDLEVIQILPPLTGARADRWISIGGVEVLHLRRQRPA